MDEVKFMCIYMDNSCEVHYDTADSPRLILSPCGSEFVFRTYADNVIKNTLKYRTAYAMSIFSTKLETILKERNRFCNDQPFISPILLENENKIWYSAEDLSIARWDTTPMNLQIKNPIVIDYVNFVYVWKSDCKNTKAILHFNKKIFSVLYPVKVPVSENDEYEQTFENYNRFKQAQKKHISKHIVKYTLIEQEFSSLRLPPQWADLHAKMSNLIDELQADTSVPKDMRTIENDQSGALKKSEITIEMAQAMPLSCTATHLHRFDNIETTSEPKVMYMDKTWYKFFYKNKSIEISCPISNEPTCSTLESNLNTSTQLSGNHDYLISDSPTGRYFSCFSLNRRNGNVDDVKLCAENIPSFKVYLKKIINYAQIFLKRINSLKILSNHPICYSAKKLHQNEPYNGLSNSNIPCVTIENIKQKDSTNTSMVSNASSIQSSFNTNDSNIKAQFVIKDVGHFKYLRNNSLVVFFVDKVKLFVDDYSLKMYLKEEFENSCCSIYLPDNSQHEIYLANSDASTSPFIKYINFLYQWIEWLKESENITGFKSKKKAVTEEVNLKTMQAHLSNLKLFNYSINQDINSEVAETLFDSVGEIELKMSTLRNVLAQNNNFLDSISKKKI